MTNTGKENGLPNSFSNISKGLFLFMFLCNRQAINTPITKQNQDNKKPPQN